MQEVWPCKWVFATKGPISDYGSDDHIIIIYLYF